MDTTDTTGAHHDSHHIYSKQSDSFFCSCESFFSSISKRAGESFATSAGAKQKPVQCPALTARKISDKNADMDYRNPRNCG